MAKQKGGAKKLRRSAKKAAYFSRQTTITARKKAVAKVKREKAVAFFRENPLAGSPSQVRARRKLRFAKHAAIIKKELEGIRSDVRAIFLAEEDKASSPVFEEGL